MAAYRFFDNTNVDWRAIMEPHWQQTAQRMAAQPVVLCLQDPTELDFNGQQAQGPSSHAKFILNAVPKPFIKD
jgi:hypothetical protein